MESIGKAADGDSYAELYQNLLIDLPIGEYFRKFLNEITGAAAADDSVVRDNKFIEQNLSANLPNEINLLVRKIWLQDFYEFCQTELNEGSAEVMADLLNLESDMKTLQVVSNTMSENDGDKARTKRQKFISRIGYLYPDFNTKLIEVPADFKALINAVDGTVYADLLKQVTHSSDSDKHESESTDMTIGKSYSLDICLYSF